MDQPAIKNIFIIGVGGIGMSAIASLCLDKKMRVSGSDALFNSYIQTLTKRGLRFVSSLQEITTTSIDAVVYSSAIQPNHPEREFAHLNKIPLFSRKDFLALLMKGHLSLLISGCHGKTTTSALVTHVLHANGHQPSYCLGGHVPTLNFHGAWNPTPYFVAEADESDGTFLSLKGERLIITNTAIDHIDYWKDETTLKRAYDQCIVSMPKEHRILCAEDAYLKNRFEAMYYGWSSKLPLYATHVNPALYGMQFNLYYQDHCYPVQLPLIGKHNVLNSLAAFGMLASLGIAPENIIKELSTFKGVHRRTQILGEINDMTIVDDYAHHPNEIYATLKALKQHYPNRPLILLFEPHKFSRITYHLDKFSTCFTPADTVLLTSFYHAGESPNDYPQILDRLIQKINRPVSYIPFEQLGDKLSSFFQPNAVFITMGAGNVTTIGKGLFNAD